MDCLASRSLLVVLILNLAVACGPRLRTCDHPDGCGEGAYCDEPSQVCVLLLEDGGRWVEPHDGGTVAPPPTCRRGDTRSCAPGCGAVETCTAEGEWGACSTTDCGAGTACVNNRCVCTPSTCTGCCLNASECRPGDETFACGSGGSACVVCGGGSCWKSGTGNHCG